MLGEFRLLIARRPLAHLVFSVAVFTAVLAAFNLVSGLGISPIVGPVTGLLAFAAGRSRMRTERAEEAGR
jgi:hypothetical protein